MTTAAGQLAVDAVAGRDGGCRSVRGRPPPPHATGGAAAVAAWPATAAPATAGIASSRFADRAVRALLDEAELSPKPGLVDRRGSGAHRDLDLGLMRRSAQALRPWFDAMAAAALDAGAPTPSLRRMLGRLGRDAEAAMLDATGGVNTHRGAIWALGLLVAGAALDDCGATAPLAAAVVPSAVVVAGLGGLPPPADPAAACRIELPTAAGEAPVAARRIAALAGRLARLPDPGRPACTGHKGEAACRAHGVGGALGQAQAGFPAVVGIALPALAGSRLRGAGETAARLDALVALIAVLDDTCVLSRSGAAGLARLQAGAAAVAAAGGAGTLAGRRALQALDAEALALGASPGGAADLLAAALFLDRPG